MASVGVRLGLFTSSRVLREAWMEGWVGTSVGRRLVSAHPLYDTHLSVLLISGRVSSVLGRSGRRWALHDVLSFWKVYQPVSE